MILEKRTKYGGPQRQRVWKQEINDGANNGTVLGNNLVDFVLRGFDRIRVQSRGGRPFASSPFTTSKDQYHLLTHAHHFSYSIFASLHDIYATYQPTALCLSDQHELYVRLLSWSKDSQATFWELWSILRSPRSIVCFSWGYRIAYSPMKQMFLL